MRAFVIGLGSNLGKSEEIIADAVLRLRSIDPALRVSGLYLSEAQDKKDQPDFYNCAVLLRTDLEPIPLLDKLLAIEKEFGRKREREEAKGPRTLDLDILFASGLVVNSPRLELPHPRLSKRAFALLPLLDLLPDAVDPISGKHLSEYASIHSGQRVERLTWSKNTPTGRV